MTICRGSTVYFVLVDILVQSLVFSHAIQRSHFCQSYQRGEVGKTGIISCNVTTGFVGVYWFEGSNEKNPLIRYEDKTKAGRGHRSGEYDVVSNGSLVINTVSPENDMYYTLFVIDALFFDFEEVVKFEVIDTIRNFSRHQQGRLGTQAIITWHIDPGFEGVYWFDEKNDKEPVVRLEGGIKSGRLYNVEYDINDDGSLVIRNVSPEHHDTVYTLLVIDVNYHVIEEEIHFTVVDLQSPIQVLTTPPTIMFSTKSQVPSQPSQTSKSSQSSEQLHTSVTVKPSKVSKPWQTPQLSQSPKETIISTSAEYKIGSSKSSNNVMTSHILEPTRTHQSTTAPNLSVDEDHHNGSHRMLSCQNFRMVLLMSSFVVTNMIWHLPV